MTTIAAAVAVAKSGDATFDLSVTSIDESNPSEVRSQDSLADAAYGPESSMSLSRISFDRSNNNGNACSHRASSRRPHPHAPRHGKGAPSPQQPPRPPPQQQQQQQQPQQREANTCYVDTENPRSLTTEFIEERLRKLARVLVRLVPGGVAHQKLSAQRDRLSAELARRRDADRPGARDGDLASMDSSDPVFASRPTGSALRAVLAVRAADPCDMRVLGSRSVDAR